LFIEIAPLRHASARLRKAAARSNRAVFSAWISENEQTLAQRRGGLIKDLRQQHKVEISGRARGGTAFSSTLPMGATATAIFFLPSFFLTSRATIV
jgi:hypothetical protein